VTESGFIRIYRKLLDWEWFQDGNTLKLFMYLLLTAYFKPSRLKGIELLPGQVVVSFRKVCEKTGLSLQELRTAVNHLKSTHEITCHSTHRCTLVTIINWASYQSDGVKSTQSSTQSSTSHQHTGNTPSYKNNENNAKKDTSDHTFAEFYACYPRKVKRVDAEKAWAKLGVGDDLFIRIMLALDLHKKSFGWKKDGGRFIPYPSTWLNGRRWEDDPAIYSEIEAETQQVNKSAYDNDLPGYGGLNEKNG
jgi:hypothetical protein